MSVPCPINHRYFPTGLKSTTWKCLALALALFASTFTAARTARADFDFDPAYNPNYTIDAFATSDGSGAYRLGYKLATLPDGDSVVAGIMRFPGDPLEPLFSNLGLVRYDSTGIRRTWSAPIGPYSWFNSQYVAYPNKANGSTGDERITNVADVAYADGKIYVLTARWYDFAPFDSDVVVLVFNDDGSFRERVLVMGSPSEEFAIALDVRETGIPSLPVAVTVLAQRDYTEFLIAKLNETSSGNLEYDSAFNGGAPMTITLPPCSSGPTCSVIPSDVVRPDRLFGFDQEPIYLLGTAYLNGTDTDMLVVKLLANGTMDTGWGINGLRFIAFDQPGSDLSDGARALEVSSVGAHSGFDDTLWVAGTVNRSCKPGIGVAKLQPNGQFDFSFGNNGRVVHGGSTETGSVCEFDAALEARDMTLQDGELAVAGTTSALDQGETLRTDGVLLRVGANSATLRDLVGLPLLQNGSRVGNSYVYGIANAGAGRYLISGDGEWTGVLESLYLTARLWFADRIFANSFEASGGASR